MPRKTGQGKSPTSKSRRKAKSSEGDERVVVKLPEGEDLDDYDIWKPVDDEYQRYGYKEGDYVLIKCATSCKQGEVAAVVTAEGERLFGECYDCGELGLRVVRPKGGSSRYRPHEAQLVGVVVGHAELLPDEEGDAGEDLEWPDELAT